MKNHRPRYRPTYVIRDSLSHLFERRFQFLRFCAYVVLIALVFVFFANAIAHGQGRHETLIEQGDPRPGGSGSFDVFNAPLLNNNGQLAFIGGHIGAGGVVNDGIFRAQLGQPTVKIVLEGESAPDANGIFSSVGQIPRLRLNESGQVAFYSLLGATNASDGSENEGIFRGSGGVVTQLLREGQSAGGNEVFLANSVFGFNQAGQVGYQVSRTDGVGSTDGIYSNSGVPFNLADQGGVAPSGGTYTAMFDTDAINNNGEVSFVGRTSIGIDGVYRASTSSITTIVKGGDAAPDGNGTFSFFGHGSIVTQAINDGGTVGFWGRMTGTALGLADNDGIFRGSGGSVIQIARDGQIVPGGDGEFSFEQTTDPRSIRINASGQVAFRSRLRNTSGGTTDDSALYLSSADGSSLVEIVREGQLVPGGGGGTFANINSAALNDHGQVAFFQSASTGVGGGIFIGDGQEMLTVAQIGQSLQGSTILSLRFQQGNSARSGLNDLGQVAYSAGLSDGNSVLNIWTPEVHWRSSFGGNWDKAATNWTLGIQPGSVHDTFLDANTDVNIIVRNRDETVRTLEVGGGTGLVTLSLDNGHTLTSTHGMTILSNGILDGDGTIAGDISNQGTIGLSFGSSIIGQVTNNASGIINVNAGANNYSGVVQNGTLSIAGVVLNTDDFSGDGGFTGGGTLRVSQNLDPGNSAASILMDGNLLLDPTTSTLIELGGRNVGEFDQVVVTGDLTLSGDLLVDVISGFDLTDTDEFLIADVGGVLTGQFNGLGEGDLVGNFGGHNMFISYASGDGNDVALFTSVPEPGTFAICLLGLIGLGMSVRRNKTTNIDRPKYSHSAKTKNNAGLEKQTGKVARPTPSEPAQNDVVQVISILRANRILLLSRPMWIGAWTFALLLPLQAAQADLIYSPTEVIANTIGESHSSTVEEQMIDHSGLSIGFGSGVTDFDTYMSLTPLHNSFTAFNSWVGNFNSLPGHIDFDMGQTLDISRLVLWGRDGASGSVIAIKDFEVFVSNSSAFPGGGISVGSFSATTGNNDPSNAVPQVFDLTDTTGRYVRVRIDNVHVEGLAQPLIGEIAFAGTAAIPEPGTAAICAIGVIGIAGFCRRRNRLPIHHDFSATSR